VLLLRIMSRSVDFFAKSNMVLYMIYYFKLPKRVLQRLG
jgi:hypothetical protein